MSPVDGGIDRTFSSISRETEFLSGHISIPIIVADEHRPGQLVIDRNATVYEINPRELGTIDPIFFGFAPLEHLSSNFSDGQIARDGKCVIGFDNTGYIMGTSSSLFNQGLLRMNGNQLLARIVKPFI